MNHFCYENQGPYTYLVYELQAEDYLDQLSFGMLTNNQINGLATTNFSQMDDKKFLKYNVSSKVSVKQLFNSPVHKHRLITILKGIINTLLCAEDYMIDVGSIVLDLDYIFADVSSNETLMICVPIYLDQKEIDLNKFFKEIMFSTQFDQSESLDYVAKIINFLNSSAIFSLKDFNTLLSTLELKEVAKAKPAPIVKQESMESRQANIENETLHQQSVAQKERLVAVEHKQPVAKVQQPSVQVPPKQSAVKQAKVEHNQKETNEKEISLFGLLSHYSAENRRLYKEQQQRKKELKNEKKQSSKKENVVESKQVDLGFAMPNQGSSLNLANKNDVVNTEVKKNMVEQQNSQPAQPVASNVVNEQNYSSSANFGETTVLSAVNAGETTVLVSQNQQKINDPYLIRKKNNEKILLNKPYFRIGKERSYVDYFVGDNTAVSRSHATIHVEQGYYTIMDTNSTNHTFINGKMIQSNVEFEIKNGDRITLANEDFEFFIS